MILAIRPLTGLWTKPATRQRHSTSYFKASWSDTLNMLEFELEQLKATAVVLQLDVTEADITLGGQLRANARPATPKVRVVFDCIHGQLSYETDAFESWRHGVRAIALGLEALRKVDRYGITGAGEQYKGWLQLEAAPEPESPRSLLARVAGVRYIDGESNSDLWRQARAAAHPDRNAGDRALWDQVEAAAKTLGLTN